MQLAGYLLRTRLRHRWRGLLAVALLGGLAAGAVLAFAGGARRTETAYDRFREASGASPLLVSTFEGGGYEPIADIRGVAQLAALAGVELYPVDRHADVDIITRASVDGAYGYRVDRPKLVEGRMPQPDRPLEVLVNPAFASTFDLGAGDRMTLAVQDFFEYLAAAPPAAGTPLFDVVITGIGVTATEVVPTTELDALPGILVTPAMMELLVEVDAPLAFDGVAVQLEPTADLARVTAAIEDLMGADSVLLLDSAGIQATVERAIRPQATALWVFTIVLLVVGVLVVLQAVARQARAGAADDASLEALGVRREQVVRVAALEGAVVGVAAAAVGIVVAVAASSAFPVGRAAIAEPNPGLSANLALLAPGALGVVLLVVAGSVATTVRVARSRGRPPAARRPSWAVGRAAALGAGPRLVLGLRGAFETGDGPTAVPVRSGLTGSVLAVAAVVAATTFAASLDTLVSQPERYGLTWTTSIDAQFGVVPVNDIVRRYGQDGDVDAIAGITYGELSIGETPVPVIGLQSLVGSLDLAILDGRTPSGEGEVALGSSTLDDIGASVGDTVAARAPDGPAEWRIVGQVVFPQLSRGSFSVLGLGIGGVVHASALPSASSVEDVEEEAAEVELPHEWTVEDFFIDDRAHNAVLLRAAPGAEARLIERIADDPASIFGHTVLRRPAAISTYAEVRGIPVALAVVLAVLAAALVAHVLAMSVRRRRVEFATCRALGMRATDVARVVRWQATALAAVALALGVPLGLAGGRVAWSLFAADLGVATTPTTPWLWLAVAVLATALITQAGGAVPAFRARRLPPATLLRSE